MSEITAAIREGLFLRALFTAIAHHGLLGVEDLTRLRLQVLAAGVEEIDGFRGFLRTAALPPRLAEVLGRLLPPDPDGVFAGCRRLAFLAEGGMGHVWLAEREGGLCVVKVRKSDRDGDGDPAGRLRFDREVRITATLDHPHVVRCFAHGQRDGCGFLVLEYVEGGDVAILLRDAPNGLPEIESLAIVAQAVRGLRHAWDKGLVHRDIKPGNFFITANGVVKVADFGLARPVVEDAAQPVTSAGAAVGSPAYMAPEQIRTGVVDWRSDVYAMGCVLQALLTGSPPYGGTMRQMLQQHLRGNPPPVTVPVSAETIILLQRCLARDPAGRFTEPAELTLAIDAALMAAGGQRTATLSTATITRSHADPRLRDRMAQRSPSSSGAMRAPGGGFRTGHLGWDGVPLTLDATQPDGRGDVTTHTVAMPLTEVPTVVLPPETVIGETGAVFAGDWTQVTMGPVVTIEMPGAGRVVLLAKDSIDLGKQGTDVLLRDYPSQQMLVSCGRVSRRHCRIAVRDDAIVVEDLGSTNGTLVDGVLCGVGGHSVWRGGEEHVLSVRGSVELAIRGRIRRHAAVGVIACAPAGDGNGLDRNAIYDAVLMRRPANRTNLLSAMVLRTCSIGPAEADLPLDGWPGGPPVEIARWAGAWIARVARWHWVPLRTVLPAAVRIRPVADWDG